MADQRGIDVPESATTEYRPNWVPCLCDRCALAFMTDFPILAIQSFDGDEPVTHQQPETFKYEPCPRCGGTATVFTGTPVQIDGEAFWATTSDRQLLTRLAEHIKQERLTAAEAADRLEQLSPAFSGLAAWLREKQHISGWLAVVLAVIALVPSLSNQGMSEEDVQRVVTAVVHAQDAERPDGSSVSKVPGRNDPCWCGSDIKFKFCHANPRGPVIGDKHAAVDQDGHSD